MDLIISNVQLCVGQHRLEKGLPFLVKLHLGWIFGGRISNGLCSESRLCSVITNEQLDQQLSQFWELEDVPWIASHPCEDQFLETVRGDSSVHYIVHIPFTEDVHELGDSRAMTEK